MKDVLDITGSIFWFGMVFTIAGILGIVDHYPILGFPALIIGILFFLLAIFNTCWMAITWFKTRAK